jgi:hypothetical protein
MVEFLCCLIKMNESIIVYLAFIAIIMYFDVVPSKESILEILKGKGKGKGKKEGEGNDYRDFLCKTRKCKKERSCNSVINLNERSLSMSPGNLRDKVFYDF